MDLSGLIFVALAVTSTKGAIRRMGKRWIRLHRLVYAAAVLGVIHYLWSVKKDIEEPLMYGAFLGGLLVWRWFIHRKRAAAHARPAPEPAVA